ncbi:unnamed protein product, partial [Symbiodinium necroappetens]
RMAPPTVRRTGDRFDLSQDLATVTADTTFLYSIAAEPQKVKSFASTVQPGVNSDGEVPSDLNLALLVDRSLELPGLEHRPFSDEEIKEAFATFDLDNNRFVGAAESECPVVLISHILKLIGEEEIDEMIRMCDTDGDGQVTFDEFYKMMTTPAATAELSKNKGDWRAQQNAAAAVSEMGNVRELLLVEQLIHKLSGGMGKIKPSQIKKIYKRFGDGLVSVFFFCHSTATHGLWFFAFEF